MVDVGKREDRLLDHISEQRDRIQLAIDVIEEAQLARPGDALLDRLWGILK